MDLILSSIARSVRLGRGLSYTVMEFMTDNTVNRTHCDGGAVATGTMVVVDSMHKQIRMTATSESANELEPSRWCSSSLFFAPSVTCFDKFSGAFLLSLMRVFGSLLEEPGFAASDGHEHGRHLRESARREFRRWRFLSCSCQRAASRGSSTSEQFQRRRGMRHCCTKLYFWKVWSQRHW